MGDDNSAGVGSQKKEPFDVRVFVASRLIKQEAMEVFFLDNIFRLHVYDYRRLNWANEDRRPLPVFLRPGIASWPMEKLSRFDIVVLIVKQMEEENDVRYLSSVAKRYVFSKFNPFHCLNNVRRGVGRFPRIGTIFYSSKLTLRWQC